MARQEGGAWRAALESSPGVIPPFGDAAWEGIKPQAGSTLKEEPTLSELIFLTNDLDPIDAEVTKRAVAGTLNMVLEAPATAGAAPSLDKFFTGLMGTKVTTAAMANPSLVNESNVEVDEVDANLVAGMSILLKIVDNGVNKDWPTAVIAITENMSPTADNLEIFPPLPSGATLQGGFVSITGGVHYRPKVSTTTDVSLPSLAFSRLYDDIDEYWTWGEAKISQMNMDMSVGNFITPSFNVVAKEENVADGETGTVAASSVANPMVPLGMAVALDSDRPTWISSIGLNFNNALGEKEGVESETGLTGHSENTREVTVGLNFQYENKDELIKAKSATKRQLHVSGKRSVGGSNRWFSAFFGKMVATSIDTPVSERLLKYDITFKAFRWQTGSDLMFLSFM